MVRFDLDFHTKERFARIFEMDNLTSQIFSAMCKISFEKEPLNESKF